MKNKLLATITSVTMVAGMSGAAATTLSDVKAKGYVQCGVHTGLSGFASTDAAGNWKGLDVDLCRAVAAAIFGDATKVQYKPLTFQTSLPALKSGETDMQVRNTTWTISRDAGQGFNFRAINFYAGQAFMVRKSLGVASVKELSGATICIPSGTTTELNTADFFRSNNLVFKPVVFEKLDEVTAAYEAGRCDAYTTDNSGLASVRLKLSKPEDHIILPDVISKEPLGPVVRQGDEQWFDIVTWSHYAMVQAEEFGITQANVDSMRNAESPDIRRFLGSEADSKIGTDMGLTNDWAYNVIKEVGNYGEAFERNVGLGSPLKVERGLNALWTKGGLQYSPPIR